MALASLKKQKRATALRQAPQPVDSAASASDGSNDGSESESHTEGNAGWADSIAKVLNTTKPKTKKTLVLSRAKKGLPGNKAKSKKEDYGFEVDGEEQVEEKKPDQEQLEQEKLKQRKNQMLALRVKPSWRDMERERALRKVATRGVVQLFNAVRIQQKDLQFQLQEAGPLDSRKDAVLNNINKRKFLDVLMSGNRAKSEAVDNLVKDELKEESCDEDDDDGDDDNEASSSKGKRKSTWNVLSKDFMTNKKVKHWDEEDDDEDNSAQSAADSDDDE